MLGEIVYLIGFGYESDFCFFVGNNIGRWERWRRLVRLRLLLGWYFGLLVVFSLKKLDVLGYRIG